MRVRVFAAPVMAFAALMLASAPAGAHPLHWFYPRSFSQPPTTAQCEATTAPLNLACYSPAQIREAYNMKPLYGSGLKGQGQTIVIVDSYGSPTIRSDLQSFDQSYGLPAPPSLKIIQPAGTPPAYDPNDSDMGGWAFETSLDVEWAHTMAPDANILLVETPTDETEGVQGLPQMVEAENYVVDHNLGDVISQSFGATEETFPNAQSIYNLRSAYKNAAAHHVTVLAAAGDAGATDDELDALDYYPQRAIDWPSSDPLDTSVGGTQLHLDSSGVRTAPDNVWNDTTLLGDPASGGGGISSVFGRPSYQDGVAGAVGSSRGTPDVAMSAAVDGGVNVYIGFTNPAYGVAPGWYIVGGTSEASPLTSGIVAIADQAAGHRLGLLNPKLYALGDGSGSGIVDVTHGDNTVTFTETDPNYPDYGQTFTVQGYDAVSGYDLSSGLGTINGTRLVGQLTAPRASRRRSTR